MVGDAGCMRVAPDLDVDMPRRPGCLPRRLVYLAPPLDRESQERRLSLVVGRPDEFLQIRERERALEALLTLLPSHLVRNRFGQDVAGQKKSWGPA